MSSYAPPSYVVSIYNPAYYATSSGGLSLATATSLFLNKNTADTATALETFNAGIATNSIAPTSSTSDMTFSSSSNTGTISIDTGKTGSTAAAPAISIGTSAVAKTIKLGVAGSTNTNSIHLAGLDITNIGLNNITGTTGNLTIGNLQSTGTIDIGGLSTRTGAITIGNGTGILPITIGSTAATSTVTINNPIMALSYTTLPTYVAGQIGYTYTYFLVSDLTVSAGGGVINFSNISLPPGIYACSWQYRIYNSLSTGTSSITNMTGYIAASSAFIGSTYYPTVYGIQYVGQTTSINNTLTQGLSGSSIITVTSSSGAINMAAVVNFTTTTGTLAFRGTVGTPNCYCIATRIA